MKNRENKDYRNYWILAAIFVAAKFCLHVIVASNYELHRDEMLYFNMGSHPAFGYLTVPPFTGFLAFAVKSVFGYSVWGIRLIPAVFGAATLYIIAKFVKDLGGNIAALTIASLTFILMPGFLLIFSLFTPNAMEIFFWSLCIYLLFRLATSENQHIWIWIGIVIGISFNTKYSIAFVAVGFLSAILLCREHKLLFSWWFVAGIIIALLLVLPNILWQYNHNWPVIYHFEELKKTQISNLKYSDFFYDLFTLNSALIIVWLMGLGMLILGKTFRKYRFFGIAFLITFLIFTGLKGKAYYVSGLLPVLIAFGAIAIEKNMKHKIIVVAGFASLALYSLLSLPFVLPVLTYPRLENYANLTRGWITSPFMRWEDGKQYNVSQVFADMTGWEELTAITAQAFKQLNNHQQKTCTIICERNYGYAGAIHFYGKKYGLPQPVTFLESYIFWAPDSIPQGPAIYINYETGDMNELFDQTYLIGTVTNNYFREKGVKVFLCRGQKETTPDIYRKEIAKERQKFTRNHY